MKPIHTTQTHHAEVCPTCNGRGRLITCEHRGCRDQGFCLHGNEQSCPDCGGEGIIMVENKPSAGIGEAW